MQGTTIKTLIVLIIYGLSVCVLKFLVYYTLFLRK